MDYIYSYIVTRYGGLWEFSSKQFRITVWWILNTTL